MIKYQDWLKDFLEGKTEVPTVESTPDPTIHSLRRFREGKNGVWEIGLTYTGRVVVRSGQLGGDGTTVVWRVWSTRHDVEPPREGD